MLNLKSLMSLALLSLMATSCLTLDGHLDVKQAMSAKKKSGFLNLKTSEIRIEPDNYMAELKVNSDKSYTLKLSGREKILIGIKSEKNLNIPFDGEFKVSHNDINQPFDLSGVINTDVSDSERTDTIRDCSVNVTENHCQKICEKDVPCKIVCKDEIVALSGRQEYSYHTRSTHRDMSIDFLKADKAEVLASFHGTDTQYDTISDYVGECILLRRF